MKQINEFIIKKVTSTQTNEIDLFVEIDSVPKIFNVKFEVIDGAFLFDFPTELEFLLRANEVSLSKSLIDFLSKTPEAQSNTSVVLSSQKNRKRTRTLKKGLVITKLFYPRKKTEKELPHQIQTDLKPRKTLKISRKT